MGYLFPSTPATPKQIAYLRRLMRDHLRNTLVCQYPEVSVDLLGDVMGLADRQAQTVVSKARNLDGTAEANLVLIVLHGMHTGELAGVRGTPKNMDTRWLFRTIYEFIIISYRDLPSSIFPNWIPLPSSAALRDHSNDIARLRDSSGDEFDTLVWTAEDGSHWIKDPSSPKNFEAFRMWHAAFRADYRKWIRGD
jgi:hypothetical protein